MYQGQDTQICRHWERSGSCAYPNCKFAHSNGSQGPTTQKDRFSKEPNNLPKFAGHHVKKAVENQAKAAPKEWRQPTAAQTRQHHTDPAIGAHGNYVSANPRADFRPPHVQTQICWRWERSGSCADPNCKFAHPESQRATTQKDWFSNLYDACHLYGGPWEQSGTRAGRGRSAQHERPSLPTHLTSKYGKGLAEVRSRQRLYLDLDLLGVIVTNGDVGRLAGFWGLNPTCIHCEGFTFLRLPKNDRWRFEVNCRELFRTEFNFNGASSKVFCVPTFRTSIQTSSFKHPPVILVDTFDTQKKEDAFQCCHAGENGDTIVLKQFFSCPITNADRDAATLEDCPTLIQSLKLFQGNRGGTIDTVANAKAFSFSRMHARRRKIPCIVYTAQFRKSGDEYRLENESLGQTETSADVEATFAEWHSWLLNDGRSHFDTKTKESFACLALLKEKYRGTKEIPTDCDPTPPAVATEEQQQEVEQDGQTNAPTEKDAPAEDSKPRQHCFIPQFKTKFRNDAGNGVFRFTLDDVTTSRLHPLRDAPLLGNRLASRFFQKKLTENGHVTHWFSNFKHPWNEPGAASLLKFFSAVKELVDAGNVLLKEQDQRHLTLVITHLQKPCDGVQEEKEQSTVRDAMRSILSALGGSSVQNLLELLGVVDREGVRVTERANSKNWKVHATSPLRHIQDLLACLVMIRSPCDEPQLKDICSQICVLETQYLSRSRGQATDSLLGGIRLALKDKTSFTFQLRASINALVPFGNLTLDEMQQQSKTHVSVFCPGIPSPRGDHFFYLPAERYLSALEEDESGLAGDKTKHGSGVMLLVTATVATKEAPRDHDGSFLVIQNATTITAQQPTAAAAARDDDDESAEMPQRECTEVPPLRFDIVVRSYYSFAVDVAKTQLNVANKQTNDANHHATVVQRDSAVKATENWLFDALEPWQRDNFVAWMRRAVGKHQPREKEKELPATTNQNA